MSCSYNVSKQNNNYHWLSDHRPSRHHKVVIVLLQITSYHSFSEALQKLKIIWSDNRHVAWARAAMSNRVLHEYLKHSISGYHFHFQSTFSRHLAFSVFVKCAFNPQGWFGSLVAKALDLQLEGCEFNSRLRRCRITTLGKLFTPMCLSRSQWFGDGMTDCGVRGRGELCLSRQPLWCTALGMGCAPFLQCLDQLGLPPAMGL